MGEIAFDSPGPDGHGMIHAKRLIDAKAGDRIDDSLWAQLRRAVREFFGPA